MPTLRGQTVWLPNLVRENPWIDGYTFEDCTLVGPIAIIPRGCTLEHNTFDGSGVDAFLVPMPEGVTITWAAGLRNSVVRRCRLKGVALVGTPDDIAVWRRGFDE